MGFLSGLISAGAGLLGGALKDKSAAKANEQNIALQKEFAQSGVQWKVADARKAGVHPLYALGAQTHSFSPSVVGSDGVASGLASAGQDISRAISANSPQSSRDRIYTDQLQALTLKKFGLENELLASQVAKSRAQLGPAIPTDGLMVGGRRFKPNPKWSSASDIQDRLGEMAEWLYSPFVMSADIQYNERKRKARTVKDLIRGIQSFVTPGSAGGYGNYSP